MNNQTNFSWLEFKRSTAKNLNSCTSSFSSDFIIFYHFTVCPKNGVSLPKIHGCGRLVTDSPQGSGELLKFIRTFLGNSLWCFIPKTLTAAGLKLLENRCPKLKYLLVNYTHKTQSQHFRHLNLGLYFPVKADGVILRIPLSPVDDDLVGYLVASKNLKRVDWNIVQQFEEFAPIVKMVADVKGKGSVERIIHNVEMQAAVV